MGNALFSGGDLDLPIAYRLAQYFKEARPDIVHCHSRRGADILGGLAASFADIPTVVHQYFQKRGLGKALMIELEKRARAGGLLEAELSVSLPSRGFYEKLGYKTDEVVSMGKRLVADIE